MNYGNKDIEKVNLWNRHSSQEMAWNPCCPTELVWKALRYFILQKWHALWLFRCPSIFFFFFSCVSAHHPTCGRSATLLWNMQRITANNLRAVIFNFQQALNRILLCLGSLIAPTFFFLTNRNLIMTWTKMTHFACHIEGCNRVP